MKKQLIALAVFSALASPAFANKAAEASSVTLYGRLDLGFVSFDNGSISKTRVDSHSSRIGFKGEEDLGGGLKGIFQIESTVAVDNSANSGTFASRNSFVGLKGGFGTAIIGRHDTPFKAISSSKNVDAMFGNAEVNEPFVNGASAFRNFHGRPANNVQYWTPTLSGFQARLSYVPDEAKADSTRDAAGNTITPALNRQQWSLSAGYDQGPLNAAIAYEKRIDANKASNGGADDSAVKLVGGYAFPTGTTVGVSWSRFSAEAATGRAYAAATGTGATARPAVAAAPASTSLKQSVWSVVLQQKIDKAAIKGAFASAGDVTNSPDTGARMFSLEGDYNLSKRTTAYAFYSRINNKSKASFAFRADTGVTTATGGPSAPGKNISILGVGVRHNF